MERKLDDLGFRRRCGWCGVQLRLWQLNLCRQCKVRAEFSPSPPCGKLSRIDAKPDAFPISYDDGIGRRS